MKKPVIKITWSKIHPLDMKRFGFERQQPIYTLYLPFIGGFCISSYNPNDCLINIICSDIHNNIGNYSPRMQVGNKSLVWGADNWERVINAPLPKYPSLDPRDNP